MRFPKWHEAPEELLKMDGHCGLLAAWSALHYFGKAVATPDLVASLRHSKRLGIFTVDIAASLKEHGLAVSFHSEPDNDIRRYESRGYARARRLGISVKPALSLPELLRERRAGKIPIVLFNTEFDSGHFSPLLSRRNGMLSLSYSKHGSMPTDEFLAAWTAPRILRQCVIVGR